jgi:hypothetical protein
MLPSEKLPNASVLAFDGHERLPPQARQIAQ